MKKIIPSVIIILLVLSSIYFAKNYSPSRQEVQMPTTKESAVTPVTSTKVSPKYAKAHDGSMKYLVDRLGKDYVDQNITLISEEDMGMNLKAQEHLYRYTYVDNKMTGILDEASKSVKYYIYVRTNGELYDEWTSLNNNLPKCPSVSCDLKVSKLEAKKIAGNFINDTGSVDIDAGFSSKYQVSCSKPSFDPNGWFWVITTRKFGQKHVYVNMSTGESNVCIPQVGDI